MYQSTHFGIFCRAINEVFLQVITVRKTLNSAVAEIVISFSSLTEVFGKNVGKMVYMVYKIYTIPCIFFCKS